MNNKDLSQQIQILLNHFNTKNYNHVISKSPKKLQIPNEDAVKDTSQQCERFVGDKGDLSTHGVWDTI